MASGISLLNMKSLHINTKMMTINDDKAIAPERSLSHMEISYTF